MPRARENPVAQGHEPQPIGGLSPAELHAIAIVGKEAARWRDSLTPEAEGYPIDVLIRITGTLRVGEDQTCVVSKAPELVDVLAFTLGALGEKTRAKLATRLTETFAVGNQHPEATPPDPSPEILGLATGLVDLMRKRSERTQRGNVAGQLEVTRLPPKAA